MRMYISLQTSVSTSHWWICVTHTTIINVKQWIMTSGEKWEGKLWRKEEKKTKKPQQSQIYISSSSNPRSSSGKSPTSTAEGLTKPPYFGLHSKYLFPATLHTEMCTWHWVHGQHTERKVAPQVYKYVHHWPPKDQEKVVLKEGWCLV